MIFLYEIWPYNLVHPNGKIVFIHFAEQSPVGICNLNLYLRCIENDYFIKKIILFPIANHIG